MSTDLHSAKDENNEPDFNRRKVAVGVLAALGGGLAMTSPAQAFPPGASGNFNAASRILSRYGLDVKGEFDASVAPGHDVLTVETVPQAATEYRQVVGMAGQPGEIIPCIKTSIYGDDASFTHFHPGEIVPCVRTSIENHHALARHELFDSDDGGIIPCIKVESQMLDGGHLGDVDAAFYPPGAIVPCVRVESLLQEAGPRAFLVTVEDLNEDFTVVVGPMDNQRTYKLSSNGLVETTRSGGS